MAKAKFKLDTKKIKETLSSRFEILGLAIGSVLVVLCLLWGVSTFLGASSPEPDILKDVQRLNSMRAQGGVPPSKGSKTPKGKFSDWPRVTSADVPLVLREPFAVGVAGSSLRDRPFILPVDADVQMDYLHKGIHTFQLSPGFLKVFAKANAKNDKDEQGPPVILAAAKRLVVVSATFPYNEQVKLYLKALRLDKVDDLFNKSLAPTFEGLNVERRKIVVKNGKEIVGDWKKIYEVNPTTGLGEVDERQSPVDERIDKLLRSALYDERWVDKYYDVIYGAAATPLPLLANSEEYPEIQLPGIVKRPPPLVPKLDPGKSPKNLIVQSIAAYHAPFGVSRKDRMHAPFKDNQTLKDVKFDTVDQDLQDQITGKINWFSPYGNAATPAPPDPLKPARFIDPKSKDDINKNFKAPPSLPANPKALVRFVDVDMEPGAAYEYRLQVRMANPNLGQPVNTLAYSELADVKQLASDWVVTPRISVPADDIQFYITNQERGFVTKPLGREALAIDTQTSPAAIGNKMVPFQIHRYLDSITSHRAKDASSQTYYVADWAVAERLLVGRGEPIGRPCQVDVVVWNHWRARWEIPGIPGQRDPKMPLPQAQGLAVDFRADPPVLLLDFVGGKHSYKNPSSTKGGPPTFQEESATEALLLMPDGTMQLRNARDESNNQGREIYDQWKTRVEDMLNPPLPIPPKGRGKGPP